jgi:hypothetical protein
MDYNNYYVVLTAVLQGMINRLNRGQFALLDHFLDKSIIVCQLIQPFAAGSLYPAVPEYRPYFQSDF